MERSGKIKEFEICLEMTWKLEKFVWIRNSHGISDFSQKLMVEK